MLNRAKRLHAHEVEDANGVGAADGGDLLLREMNAERVLFDLFGRREELGAEARILFRRLAATARAREERRRDEPVRLGLGPSVHRCFGR